MDFKTFFKGAVFSLIAVSLTAGFSYANQSNASKASVATQVESQTQTIETMAFTPLVPSENYIQTGTAWTLFDDYQSWPSSSTYKTNDYLRQMIYYTDMSYCGSTNGMNFFDINGDGLVDMTFAETCGSSGYLSKYALFLNVGSNSFEVGYKCGAIINNNVWTFYGDCAAL